jgi:hypothetical protein
MALVLTLFPLLGSAAVLALALAVHSRPAAKRAVACFAAAFVGAILLQNLLLGLWGELPFRLLKMAAGALFLLLWGLSVASLYRSGSAGSRSAPSRANSGIELALAVVTGALAGAIAVSALAPAAGGSAPMACCAALALAGVAVAAAALAVEGKLPAEPALNGAPLAALLVSGLLFMAASAPRLDLFAPLSMDVMKFIHDFVHQFFESMLIPDHPFFRSDVWDAIGLLFSDRVGFWGGLVIWFTPVLLVALSVRLERLPSVAHIRQGAARRKVLAGFLKMRRYRLVVPALALALLTGAVYRSTHPRVEYWDPKPVPVTASAAGEIVIPLKGEAPVADGKLHKFLYRDGARQARFFMLMTPSGRLAVALDACAICKPDGYGQSGGNVICYYCRTLIPLETMGREGGCNPVPVAFAVKGDSVSINTAALLDRWGSTVQATSRVKGGDR